MGRWCFGESCNRAIVQSSDSADSADELHPSNRAIVQSSDSADSADELHPSNRAIV
jgi:hypothetical protein